jgi:hypothetical protein
LTFGEEQNSHRDTVYPLRSGEIGAGDDVVGDSLRCKDGVVGGHVEPEVVLSACRDSVVSGVGC